MVESWIVTEPGSLDVRPSESDKRKEALVVTMVARIPDDESIVELSIVRLMERDADGKLSGLTPLPVSQTENADDVKITGVFFDLLPKERPSAEERRKARALMERLQKRIKLGKSPIVH